MPIDWNQLDNDIDNAIEQSVKATDEALASKVSSLTRLTDEEVKELFPDAADVKKLAQLMKIVKSADNRNKKIDQLGARSKEFAGVVLTLLNRFA